MTNLIVSKNPQTGDIAYIDQTTGEAYLTDTLICKMLGIDHKSLDGITSSQSVGNYADKVTEVLTMSGVRSVHNLRKAIDLKIVLKANIQHN